MKKLQKLNLKKYLELNDPLIGLTPYLARDLSYKLNIPENSIKQSTNLFINLYKLFIENDCSLVEINPLIITNNEEIIALDAKINVEDDSLFRHKDLEKFYDPKPVEPTRRTSYKRKSSIREIRWRRSGVYGKWSWFSHGYNGYNKKSWC